MISWYLLAIASALCLTGQDLVRKKMLRHEHAQQYTATRYIVLAGLGLFMLPFLQTQLSFEILFALYLASLGISFAILYITRAYKHMDISVSAPMTNLTPAFLLLFAMIFLNEKLGWIQIGGIGLLVIGAYLLEIRPHKHKNLEPILDLVKNRHMHYLIFAVIVFALTAVFEKHFVTNYLEPMTYFFFFFLFVAINFTFLQWYRYGLKEIKQEFEQNYVGYFVGGLLSLGAAITYLFALTTGPVTAIIPLRMSSTLFVTLIGGRMFKEQNGRTKALACGMMIMGAYLVLVG